jgi:hypothetical protein
MKIMPEKSSKKPESTVHANVEVPNSWCKMLEFKLQHNTSLYHQSTTVIMAEGSWLNCNCLALVEYQAPLNWLLLWSCARGKDK